MTHARVHCLVLTSVTRGPVLAPPRDFSCACYTGVAPAGANSLAFLTAAAVRVQRERVPCLPGKHSCSATPSFDLYSLDAIEL